MMTVSAKKNNIHQNMQFQGLKIIKITQLYLSMVWKNLCNAICH